MLIRFKTGLVLSLLCLLTGRVGADTGQELFRHADSLAAAGYRDSADAALDNELSRALSEYSRSDTTVEFTTHEVGQLRRYYFPSYAYAIGIYTQALRVKERISGQNDPGYVRLLNRMAELWAMQAKYVKAESLYKQALVIGEPTLASSHEDVASSLTMLGNLCAERCRYAEAESLHIRALAIAGVAQEPEPLVTAEIINNLATVYVDQGRYADAESLYISACDIREKNLPAYHPDVAASIAGLASCYAGEGRYEEAESLYLDALNRQQNVPGADSLDVTTYLCELGAFYGTLGKHSEAESLIVRALAIREKTLGPDHRDVADCISYLAQDYTDQERYSEAESLYARTAAIREKALEPGHPDLARSLSMLGRVCYFQGRYYEAESFSVRALALREAVLGPDHLDVASTLSNLVALYFSQGRYSEAESLSARVQAIDTKVLGPEHPDVAFNLLVRAQICHALGKFPEAEALYLRALSISEKAPGSDPVGLAWCFGQLGGLYFDQGRFAEAEILCKRSLDVMLKIHPAQDATVAPLANNLAAVYWRQTKYSEAEPLFKMVISIIEATYGPDDPRTAQVLANLGALYIDEGRYSDAEKVLKRALDIRMTAPQVDSTSVGLTLKHLGDLYIGMRDYAGAEQCYRWAIEVLGGSFYSGQRHLGIALMGLGWVYLGQGKAAEAEDLFKRSAAMLEDALGPGHPDAGVAAYSLAVACYSQGRYDEAESYLVRALDTAENTFGPDDPHVAVTLQNLARLYRRQRKLPDALSCAGRALSIRLAYFVRNATVLPEKDALSYARLQRGSVSTYLTCYLDSGLRDTATMKAVADQIVSSKGLVSDMALQRQKDLFQGADSTTLAAAVAMRKARYDLSKLFVRGPRGDPAIYRAEADSLSELASNLEAELLRLSDSYRRQRLGEHIDAATLALLLPERSALIEFVKYSYMGLEPWPASWTPSYLAVVIAGDRSPTVIDLGEASAIDSLVGSYRAHMLRIASARIMPTAVDQEEYAVLGRDLYRLVWRPVEEYLVNTDMVFVAPDGDLNSISFAGLLDENGRYLVDRFAFHYLSAGRDLARLAKQGESGQGLLALGDPDYDAVGSSAGAPPVAVGAALAQIGYYHTRNVRSGCERLKGVSVPALPGTRREVELVASKWNRASKEPASVYFGSDASEERLKAESSGKRVIHLATHGYFLGDVCQPDVPGSAFDGSGIGGVWEFVGENPLLLSGLFLAGCNLRGACADSMGIEDGILTAYEVSAMNLEGTDLVVLSACETGLGDVKQGEGVYGLRRAFQMAGARTVVSSLWAVPDEATADMMSGLYERRAASIPDTMRRMQLQKIRDLRRHRKADHPYTWAGFIATGDWR